jgi:hypothetical protein
MEIYITMAIQRILDRTGDTRHEFDPADALAVVEAEKRFKEITGRGFLAFDAKPGQSTMLRAFDPNVDETVFTPQRAGG